jgi:hypothetical protein
MMSWRDRSADTISGPSKRAFSSTVISNLVEMSLGAKTSLDNRVTRLRWRLGCAASEVVKKGNNISKQYAAPKRRADVDRFCAGCDLQEKVQ